MVLMFILFLSTQYPAEHLFSLHGRTRLRGPPFRKLRSIRHKGHVIPRIFPLLQKLNAAADVISKDTPNDWVKFSLNSPCSAPRIRSQTRGQLSFLCCRFRVRMSTNGYLQEFGHSAQCVQQIHINHGQLISQLPISPSSNIPLNDAI